jgi:voltage-gated potassium channel
MIAQLWRKVRFPFVLLLATFALGSLGFRAYYPQETWTNIFFMTAISLTTVGYGDILGVQANPAAVWYTILLLFAGMGVVLYCISAFTAVFVESHLSDRMAERRMLRRITHMQDHFIICGAGQTGVHVVREMHASKRAFVVVEGDERNVEALKREFEDILVVHGDATLDATLRAAGVEKASGLIAALSNDKDNLFLTLTARMLNPTFTIISRGIDLSIHAKLKSAGANHVISPNFIGGMRIAAVALRPEVVTFLDRMLRGKDKSIRVEEVRLPQASRLAGKTLGDAQIFEHTGLQIIAYSLDGSEESYIYNPGGDTRLNPGGVLLFIGGPEQRAKLEHLAAAR